MLVRQLDGRGVAARVGAHGPWRRGSCLGRTRGGWCRPAASGGAERYRPARNGPPPGGFSQDGTARHVPADRRPAPPYITAYIAGPFAGSPVQYRAQCTKKCAPGAQTGPRVHCEGKCTALYQRFCRPYITAYIDGFFAAGNVPRPGQNARQCARECTVGALGRGGPPGRGRPRGRRARHPPPAATNPCEPHSECSAANMKSAPLGVPRGARAIRCA